MWARVARLEGDRGDIDARVERLSSAVESGGLPPELADAKFLLLVDRDGIPLQQTPRSPGPVFGNDTRRSRILGAAAWFRAGTRSMHVLPLLRA
jgi:hypothetical protein